MGQRAQCMEAGTKGVATAMAATVTEEAAMEKAEAATAMEGVATAMAAKVTEEAATAADTMATAAGSAGSDPASSGA